ncbi:MAG: alpha/beta hydrolase family protein [Terriglobales bacterium]
MTRILRLALIVSIVMITSVVAQLPGAAAAAVAGWWTGQLTGTALHLTLQVQRRGQAWDGVLFSLDQSPNGMPATVTVQGNRVVAAVAAAQGTFAGTLQGDRLVGSWTQSGHSLALTLQKLQLTQRPRPPYPYRSLTVTVPSVKGIQLAGTLTVPQGKGPFPAAILIAGSGPHGRNEDLFGHQIFWVLADSLSRHGLAVLRVDKRGIGKSGGDYATATTEDFARDVAAGLVFLQKQSEIDPHRIGLIGHSEGGLIAPIVASRHRRAVAFVVMLAGPALPGSAIIVAQTVAANRVAGASPAALARIRVEETKFVDTVKSAPDAAAVPAALRAAVNQKELPAAVLRAAAVASSPWYYEFLKLDPAPYLRQLRCPVLALDGSKDTQVPAAENIPALDAALANDPHATIVAMTGLNHVFQPAKTGALDEYASSPITFAPAALHRIEQWLAGVVGTRAPQPQVSSPRL